MDCFEFGMNIGVFWALVVVVGSFFNFVESVQADNVKNEYIVIFNKYMEHDAHEHLLQDSLVGMENEWHIIKRNNPASMFPSDFALISTTNTNVIGLLEHLNFVRHVIPQKRIVNPLQGYDEDLSDFQQDLQEEDPSTHLVNGTQQGRYHRWFPESETDNLHLPGTRKLHSSVFQVTDMFNAHDLWKKHTGSTVNVAIFDTGLRRGHPHFRNVVDITNWTDEDSTEDGLGHGTFVTGVIASSSECLGFAPDANIHVYRVFTNNRVSYTSWFLDAFNHALRTGVDVLNLSIGGPDFMDRPFVEKVWELSANGIIVVSAIGNDGPLYGTLNNPADQFDVIGVGGINFAEKIARFSSRGMTTWELPDGYGRVKPDILAYGELVHGSKIYGGCRPLSGTSMACPVVTGAVALLASTVPEYERKAVINPASIKQVLIESAERLPAANIFEQGFGKLNLIGAYKVLADYKPRASLAPSSLDLTDCPYMWPYCDQPLYAHAIPIIANITILNAMGVSGKVDFVEWQPGKNGNHLTLTFSHSETIWPWTGYLAIHITVSPAARLFNGVAEGVVLVNVSTDTQSQIIELPVKAKIVPTPHRSRRLLWDQFHNLRYPSGYFPRDALEMKDELFDWNGDHPHTNFKSLYTSLRELGYFIEILGSPFTCFDATQYGALIIMDPEEEYHPAEIAKLEEDVQKHRLSVIVIGDWYNVDVMKKINFYDDNAKQWWTPLTGGANVPAINDLLGSYGIVLGNSVYDGEIRMGDQTATYSSGTSIVSFPAGGFLTRVPLTDQTSQILRNKSLKNSGVAVLGLYSPPVSTNDNETIADPTEPPAEGNITQSGTIVVFGDSSCFDDANEKQSCHWLMSRILQVTNFGADPITELSNTKFLADPYMDSSWNALPPARAADVSFAKYSRVAGKNKPLTCPPQLTQSHPFVWKDERNLLSTEWVERQVVPRARPERKPDYIQDPKDVAGSFGYVQVYFLGCVAVVFIIAVFVRAKFTRGKERYREVPVNVVVASPTSPMRRNIV